MERVAEAVSEGMGTVRFVVISTTVIVMWVAVNHVTGFLAASWKGLLVGKGFDPAPFILLNLMFSAVAFYTGALVIIASKAQAKRSQAREEADAKHREEIASEHRQLLVQNTKLTEQIHALTDQIAKRVA